MPEWNTIVLPLLNVPTEGVGLVGGITRPDTTARREFDDKVTETYRQIYRRNFNDKDDRMS